MSDDTLRPLTPEEVQAAWDAAEPVHITEDRNKEIMRDDRRPIRKPGKQPETIFRKSRENRCYAVDVYVVRR